jgi:MFS family permease
MAAFATARDVPALVAARIIQGLATGEATGAAGAALLDFEDPDKPGRAGLANSVAPVAGMAAGVLSPRASSSTPGRRPIPSSSSCSSSRKPAPCVPSPA